ncbi:hypothetical protein KP509_29G043700 [Ceratopteris richardii]|uniref:VQ domain-containing protein n=1 Tax=Ceratopteris richardii TaxID=49495 RepID=A0A8T2R6J3_CERRI|nr:hypothetical protein KP509_29G043700 [Ceratopteris richardii]
MNFEEASEDRNLECTRRKRTRKNGREAMTATAEHPQPTPSRDLSTTAFKRDPIIIYSYPPKTIRVCSSHFSSVVQSLTGEAATDLRPWRRGCPCFCSSPLGKRKSSEQAASPTSKAAAIIQPGDSVPDAKVPYRHCPGASGDRIAQPALIRPIPRYVACTSPPIFNRPHHHDEGDDLVYSNIEQPGIGHQQGSFVSPAAYNSEREGPQWKIPNIYKEHIKSSYYASINSPSYIDDRVL